MQEVFMNTMDSILNRHYMENFPTKMPLKAAQGFLVSATVRLITGCTLSLALFGGGIAAMATLIEAITRPIFRDVFPRTPNVAIAVQIIISLTMGLSLASAIAPWIGLSYKTTSFLLPLIATFCLNQDFYAKNEGLAVVL